MTPAEYKTQSATQEVNSQGNVNMYVVLKVCIIATETKHRGLVKWYDRGLQNLWWEFDSLIPCSKPLKMKAFARLRLHG